MNLNGKKISFIKLVYCCLSIDRTNSFDVNLELIEKIFTLIINSLTDSQLRYY